MKYIDYEQVNIVKSKEECKLLWLSLIQPSSLSRMNGMYFCNVKLFETLFVLFLKSSLQLRF